MKVFKCKGCGSYDSIVEVQLIPSTQDVHPDQAPNATPFEDVDFGSYVNYNEDPPVLGFGCFNDRCEFWHGNWGSPSNRDTIFGLRFSRAKALQDIATIEEVE